MRKKLLIADDSITIQKVIGLSFADEDVTVEAVSNGDLAIERVQELKPDVVLADVFMPGCNGYQVCEKVKSSPELAGIPVVLLVGTFEPFDESEAARVKCDAFLTKPFDTGELLEVVHSLMGTTPGKKRGGASGRAAKPQAQVASFTSPPRTGPEKPGVPVTGRTLESFLGPNRIFDLFDPSNGVADRMKAAAKAPQTRPAAPLSAVPAPTASGVELSEETLKIIVDRVVRRMSQDVVREVAWEVVPEMSEIIIRQRLDEQGKQ